MSENGEMLTAGPLIKVANGELNVRFTLEYIFLYLWFKQNRDWDEMFAVVIRTCVLMMNCVRNTWDLVEIVGFV